MSTSREETPLPEDLEVVGTSKSSVEYLLDRPQL